VRRALLAVAVAGVALLVWLGVRILHHPAERLGGLVQTWTVDVEHRFVPAMPAEQALRYSVRAMRQRALAFSPLARVELHDHELTVEIPGRHDPAAVIRALGRSGRLEIKLVDDASPWMRAVADNLERAPVAGVETDSDEWSEHRDPYLAAYDRQKLAATIARLAPPLPADHELVYKQLPLEAGGTYWRSYYVFREVAIGNDDIERVDVVKNPDTRRPEIDVSFTPEGRGKLAAFTSAHLDRKTVILIEGKVNSAPVISARIESGDAVISIENDAQAASLEAEARELAAVIRAGCLAAPVWVTAQRIVAR
jgi:preprotein translocase subunit SecD